MGKDNQIDQPKEKKPLQVSEDVQFQIRKKDANFESENFKLDAETDNHQQSETGGVSERIIQVGNRTKTEINNQQEVPIIVQKKVPTGEVSSTETSPKGKLGAPTDSSKGSPKVIEQSSNPHGTPQVKDGGKSVEEPKTAPQLKTDPAVESPTTKKSPKDSPLQTRVDEISGTTGGSNKADGEHKVGGNKPANDAVPKEKSQIPESTKEDKSRQIEKQTSTDRSTPKAVAPKQESDYIKSAKPEWRNPNGVPREEPTKRIDDGTKQNADHERKPPAMGAEKTSKTVPINELESKTKEFEQKSKEQEPKTKGQEPKAKEQEPKAKEPEHTEGSSAKTNTKIDTASSGKEKWVETNKADQHGPDETGKGRSPESKSGSETKSGKESTTGTKTDSGGIGTEGTKSHVTSGDVRPGSGEPISSKTPNADLAGDAKTTKTVVPGIRGGSSNEPGFLIGDGKKSPSTKIADNIADALIERMDPKNTTKAGAQKDLIDPLAGKSSSSKGDVQNASPDLSTAKGRWGFDGLTGTGKSTEIGGARNQGTSKFDPKETEPKGSKTNSKNDPTSSKNDQTNTKDADAIKNRIEQAQSKFEQAQAKIQEILQGRSEPIKGKQTNRTEPNKGPKEPAGPGAKGDSAGIPLPGIALPLRDFGKKLIAGKTQKTSEGTASNTTTKTKPNEVDAGKEPTTNSKKPTRKPSLTGKAQEISGTLPILKANVSRNIGNKQTLGPKVEVQAYGNPPTRDTVRLPGHPQTAETVRTQRNAQTQPDAQADLKGTVGANTEIAVTAKLGTERGTTENISTEKANAAHPKSGKPEPSKPASEAAHQPRLKDLNDQFGGKLPQIKLTYNQFENAISSGITRSDSDKIAQNVHDVPDATNPAATTTGKTIREVLANFDINATRRGFKPEITESGTYKIKQGQTSQRLQAFAGPGRLPTINYQHSSSCDFHAQRTANGINTKEFEFNELAVAAITNADLMDEHSRQDWQPATQDENPRRAYIIKPNDTPEYIAVVQLNDESLADLIRQINKPIIQSKFDLNKQEYVEVLPVGVMILLPNISDIQNFRSPRQ